MQQTIRTSGRAIRVETSEQLLHALCPRRWRQQGPPSTVRIAPGRYELRSPIRLDADALAMLSEPLRIIGEGAADEVVISGGVTLDRFEPDPEFRSALRCVLPPDLLPRGARLAFARNRRQDLARYPNRDPDRPYDGGFLHAETDHDLPPGADGSFTSLICRDARLRGWSRPEEAELFIYPHRNWTNQILPVRGYDADSGRLTWDGRTRYRVASPDRFFVRNVLEELDAPGEWHFQRGSRTLRWIPDSSETPFELVVPRLASVIEISGSQHGPLDGATPELIRFEHLQIEASNDAAIRIRDAAGVSIVGCIICNAGGCGVEITGGSDCRVVGCDVWDTGRDGIRISGGDLTPRAGRYVSARHVVDNCYVHHVGAEMKQVAGITVGGVGNTVRHNLVHDTPRWAISFGGAKHRIEFNHCRHCGTETADLGAIHACTRSYTSRGNRVRFNRVHDVLGFGRDPGTGEWRSPYYAFGIYLDDLTSGTEVTGNLVYRTSNPGIYIHGGADNTVEHNVLADTPGGCLALTRRSLGRDLPHGGWRHHRTIGNVFRKNLCVQPVGQPAVRLVDVDDAEPWPGLLGEAPLPGDGLAAVPEQLSHEGLALPRVETDEDVLDLEELCRAAGAVFRPVSIGFAYRAIQSARDQRLRVLIGLEWAGAVWLNGQLVLDTRGDALSEGLGSQNHVVTLDLRAESNVLAIRSTSGLSTWRVVVGPFEADADARWDGPWRVFLPIHSPPRSSGSAVTDADSIARRIGANQFQDNTYAACSDDGDPLTIQFNHQPVNWDVWRAATGEADADGLGADAIGFIERGPLHTPTTRNGLLLPPIERIGPYESDLRASWPIIEASGARELGLRGGAVAARPTRSEEEIIA